MELQEVTICEAEIKKSGGKYVIVGTVETCKGCWAYIATAYQAKREGFKGCNLIQRPYQLQNVRLWQ